MAQETGITIGLIRKYEMEGLLSCKRVSGQFREFGPEAVERVGLILACRSLQWSMANIKMFLSQDQNEFPLQKSPCIKDFERQNNRLALLEMKLRDGSICQLSSCEPEAKTLRIGELAKISQLTVKALDSMASNGLLPCHNQGGTHRHFAPSCVETVQLILALRSMGFTLPDIQEALARPLPPDVNEQYIARVCGRRKALQTLWAILQ